MAGCRSRDMTDEPDCSDLAETTCQFGHSELCSNQRDQRHMLSSACGSQPLHKTDTASNATAVEPRSGRMGEVSSQSAVSGKISHSSKERIRRLGFQHG